MKAGRGRKFQVTLSPEDYKLLEKMAREQHLRVATFVSVVLQREIEKYKEE